MAPIYREEQLRPVAGYVPRIARREKHLAIHGAASALCADADIVIQCYAIVGVF
jgi:hypothetical protein